MSKLYDELRELAVHDQTIYANLRLQEVTGASDLVVAIEIIKQLSRESDNYRRDAIRTREMSVTPIVLKVQTND